MQTIPNKLSIEGLPENLYSKFKESQQSAEAISEVFVKSEDSKDVYLEILISPNPKVGVYNLTLLVEGHYSKPERRIAGADNKAYFWICQLTS